MSWHRLRRTEIVPAAAAAAIALGLAIVALQAWRLDLHVPLRYDGDATQVLGFAQNVLESGWYLDAPRLNAPFGQQLHDYPQFAELHYLMLRVATAVTGDAAAAVTVVYLVTYPLVALAAFWALRRLRMVTPVAIVGAVIYALLPFHFVRGTVHLSLAAYYTVPIAGYVLAAAADGRLGVDSAGRWVSWRSLLRVAVLGVLIGLGNIYYSLFTLVLLVPAATLGYLRRRSAGSLAPAAAVAGHSAATSCTRRRVRRARAKAKLWPPSRLLCLLDTANLAEK